MAKVKRSRAYDGAGRLEQAQRSHGAILDVARRAFLEHGYAATTVSAIARDAAVSVETIYKAFGGKPGLVRAIYERALGGRGDTHAEARSDATSARATDPRAIVRRWGALTAEVSPLVSPILLLVREAAAKDPDLAALLRETDAQRLTRMTRNARVLAERGFLRKGLTVERAGEIMWAYSSAELYELFVLRRGWTPKQLGDHVTLLLEAALLER